MEYSDNERIAKNTVLLYFRMLLTMAVSLYTSRVVLNILGVKDFGLYNVVGGIVSMFTIINGAMSAGTSRFFTFELGKRDYVQLKKTFSAAFTIHISIALLIFVLAETIGLWFVSTQLVIPIERTNAAYWVYQLSVLSCMIQITQVPYNSAIIAHERMSVYAFVSILDSLLKLLIVFILIWSNNIDKLILYAILVLSVSVIIAMIYRIYCKHKYEECVYHFEWNKKLYKKLISFSGWDLVGNACVLTQGEGINILLNIFFGTVVNAARGVTFQVQNALNAFTNNFMTAVQPQIVKLFAENNIKKMLNLVFFSSKYSFYFLWLLSLPVLLESDFILRLWLKKVPEHTMVFLQIVLITNLIRSFARPVVIAVHASGDIKNLNLYAGGLGLFPLPVSYVLLKLGYPAESAFIIVAIWGIFANIAELIILKQRISFSIKEYTYEVYLRSLLVCIVSIILPIVAIRLMHPSLIRFLVVGSICVCSVVTTVYIIGIDASTRDIVSNKIRSIIKRYA
jgi:O-antigen/teichoic acid export membrane protein